MKAKLIDEPSGIVCQNPGTFQIWSRLGAKRRAFVHLCVLFAFSCLSASLLVDSFVDLLLVTSRLFALDGPQEPLPPVHQRLSVNLLSAERGSIVSSGELDLPVTFSVFSRPLEVSTRPSLGGTMCTSPPSSCLQAVHADLPRLTTVSCPLSAWGSSLKRV